MNYEADEELQYFQVHTLMNLTAYLDESFCFEADGMTLASTIRHANCELLVDNKVCCHCAKFRNTLRALT